MREEIRTAIKEKAIIVKSEKNNFFFNDADSNWLLDFRKIFLNADYVEICAILFWDKVEHLYPFQIGCLELSSVPMISILALEGKKRGKPVNCFIVRKQRKKTGLGNIVEGDINQEKILMFDDIINSGKSLLHSIKVLEEFGKKIDILFVFVHFGNPLGKELLATYKIMCVYEFTLSDFGLSPFGHMQGRLKEHRHVPIITPPYRRIYVGAEPNKFLFAPKTTLLKQAKYIYVGGEGGLFVKLDAETGNILAQNKHTPVLGHKNIISTPVFFDHTIIYGSYDGNVYALNLSDLSVKWTYDESDWIGSSPDIASDLNLIFIGCEHAGSMIQGSLVALDASLGIKIWQIHTNGFIHSSPKYIPGVQQVCVGTNDGMFILVDAKTGNIIHTYQLDAPIKGGFAYSVDEKYIFFGSHTKNFYGFNRHIGIMDFVIKTDNYIYSTPLVVQDNIFFSGLDQNFYHLNSAGEILNTIQTFGRNFAEPICIEDYMIVFPSNDGGIYFYDFIQKRVLFKIQHHERIVSRVVYDEQFKTIYIYDFINQIYMYDIAGYIPSQ